MARNRYHIRKIEETLNYETADSETEVVEDYHGDLHLANEALESNCWDHIDERRDCVICYPADYERDIRTGEVRGFQIIIHGKERHLDWLMRYYERNSYPVGEK